MYFNKTHCSMTFGLLSDDLQLLTPLTPTSDRGRTHFLYSTRCEETKRVIYVFYTLMHVWIQHFARRADSIV